MIPATHQAMEAYWKKVKFNVQMAHSRVRFPSFFLSWPLLDAMPLANAVPLANPMPLADAKPLADAMPLVDAVPLGNHISCPGCLSIYPLTHHHSAVWKYN